MLPISLYLLHGDMGISEETELLDLAEENGSIQQEHLEHVQILKTAHHGSKGSSNSTFGSNAFKSCFISTVRTFLDISGRSRRDETKHFLYETMAEEAC